MFACWIFVDVSLLIWWLFFAMVSNSSTFKTIFDPWKNQNWSRDFIKPAQEISIWSVEKEFCVGGTCHWFKKVLTPALHRLKKTRFLVKFGLSDALRAENDHSFWLCIKRRVKRLVIWMRGFATGWFSRAFQLHWQLKAYRFLSKIA